MLSYSAIRCQYYMAWVIRWVNWYDRYGLIILMGTHWSTQRKPCLSIIVNDGYTNVKSCLSGTLPTTNPTCTVLELNPGLHNKRPLANHLSHSMALQASCCKVLCESSHSCLPVKNLSELVGGPTVYVRVQGLDTFVLSVRLLSLSLLNWLAPAFLLEKFIGQNLRGKHMLCNSILWNNQQMQLYALYFIPLLGSLYMFRVFYTPIIRSTIFNRIYSHWYKP